MTKDQLQVLRKAIKKWGIKNQTSKIQEEALELSLALNQINCPTKNAKEIEDNLYDELADMTIMMEQAHMIFDSDRIKARVDHKIERLQSKYGL